MPFSAPTSVRSLVNAFMAYKPEVGLESILDKMEWRGVLPSQTYHAVLGRNPESAEAATPKDEYTPRDIFEIALRSSEFQDRIATLLLNAFPEKRRVIFIHLMKCAGTDLISHLSYRFPHIYSGLSQEVWVSKAELFEFIRDFAMSINNSSEVLFSGHINLHDCVEHELFRFGDDIFTIVRSPIERAMSMANYVVSVMANKSLPSRPDRIDWYKALGLTEFPRRPKVGFLQDVARAVLSHPDIIAPNLMCSSLGLGDAESALEAIVRSNIEITDAKRYGAWLHSRWGVDSSSRMNSSRKFIQVSDLSPNELERLYEVSQEDMSLYQLVERKLDDGGGASIRGLALADFRAELTRLPKAPPAEVTIRGGSMRSTGRAPEGRGRLNTDEPPFQEAPAPLSRRAGMV